MASFFIIIWSIWKERNSRIFNNKIGTTQQVQDLILIRLSWWIKGWGDPFPHSCEEILNNPSCLKWENGNGILGNVVRPQQQPLWSPPQTNHLKWNVDASVNNALSLSAIGGVLRDARGYFKCVFSCPVPPIEINSAEILAIHRAIQISINNGNIHNHQIEIESDSYNAVKWCNADEGGPWNLAFQLNLIRNARKRWLNISIHHKRRGSNIVADCLAKQGLTRENDFMAWL